MDEIVEARIWAGLHFHSADVQGLQLGTNVASYRGRKLLRACGQALTAAAIEHDREGPLRAFSLPGVQTRRLRGGHASRIVAVVRLVTACADTHPTSDLLLSIPTVGADD